MTLLSLIKIYDIDQFVLEEDLAHLDKLLVAGVDGDVPAPDPVDTAGQSGVQLSHRDDGERVGHTDRFGVDVGSHYWFEANGVGSEVTLHHAEEGRCFLCRPINSSFIEECASYRSGTSYHGLIDLITSTNVITVNNMF